MRARVEVFARRWWAGELGQAGRVLSVAALPLSWTWSAGSALSALGRAVRGATRVEGTAVVSVGNLAVGGTGKTPLVGWIGATLHEAGLTPAVLVGGHGADEALLHEKRLPGVAVLRGRDRVAEARRAAASGVDVVVLDDGFQHRRIERDLDVVLLAAEDAFPGPVLPRGPYREAARALERADLVLVTRRMVGVERSRELANVVEAGFAGAGETLVVAGVDLAAESWRDLDGRPSAAPRGDALAVCGIARPEAFRFAVAKLVAGSVELVAFADHHEYTPAEVARVQERAAGRPIVITEKDAVKLNDYRDTLPAAHVLAEDVRWDWGEEDFRERLLAVGRAP